MLMDSAWRKCNFVSYFAFILDRDLLPTKTCFGVTEIGTPVHEESPLYEYTVFPQIIGGGDFFFAQKGGNYSREGNYLQGRLFQILLTGSRALNLLSYYPIKSKK